MNIYRDTGGRLAWFRGGLAFKAHRFVYYSTLGLRVIKKKKKSCLGFSHSSAWRHISSAHAPCFSANCSPSPVRLTPLDTIHKHVNIHRDTGGCLAWASPNRIWKQIQTYTWSGRRGKVLPGPLPIVSMAPHLLSPRTLLLGQLIPLPLLFHPPFVRRLLGFRVQGLGFRV